MAIVYRLEKGTSLTHEEMDNNFKQVITGVGRSSDNLIFTTGNGTVTIPLGSTSGTGVSVLNDINNNILTATGTTGTLQGESTLTYDGTFLNVSGTLKLSQLSGSSIVIGDTSTSHTSNTSNIVIGNTAGTLIQDSCNVVLGNNTLNTITQPSGSVAIGHDSLPSIQTGRYNTSLGTGTATNVISGDRNIYIGYNAGPVSTNVVESDKLYISNTRTDTPLILGDFNTNQVTISGNVSASYLYGDGSNLTNLPVTSPIYSSSLPQNTAMSDTFRSYEIGTLVSDVHGSSLSEVIDNLLFPTVDASITLNASLNLSTYDNTTVEVGTSYTPTVTATLEKGTVTNGDGNLAGSGSNAPHVAGDMISASLFIQEPGEGSYTLENIQIGSGPLILSGSTVNLLPGTTQFYVEAEHATSNTVYEDNKGNIQTITSIENAKAETSKTSTTISKRSYYRYFYYLGARNSHETSQSNVVRTYSTGLFQNTSNTGQILTDLEIPAGTSEFVIYVPTGKTAVFFDNNANTTVALQPAQSITVNDANAVGVSYELHRADLGLNGYPNTTTFTITIS